jgi:DNA-binding transcriptional LysR family regulator
MELIDMANLSSLDLNLLLVLHTVLDERSATKAAKKLHVTQSAVSNSLSRLRAIFGDPLVVRSGAGLAPTPRAEQLAPQLAAAIAQLRAVVELERAFDRKTSARRFTLSCADYHEVVLLPRLIERFAERLPNASLRVVSAGAIATADALASGEIDALVGMPLVVPPGCLAEELFVDRVVCVVRRDHPITKKSMRASELARHPYVSVVLPDEAGSWIEAALRAAGLPLPKQALEVPHFTVAALAASRTDYLLPFPRHLARALAELLPLRVIELRDLDAPVTTNLVWHARTDADPATRFFRELVRESASGLS